MIVQGIETTNVSKVNFGNDDISKQVKGKGVNAGQEPQGDTFESKNKKQVGKKVLIGTAIIGGILLLKPLIEYLRLALLLKGKRY